MNNFFPRILTLVLIPCLGVDPSLAAVWAGPSASTYDDAAIQGNLFSDQAVPAYTLSPLQLHLLHSKMGEISLNFARLIQNSKIIQNEVGSISWTMKGLLPLKSPDDSPGMGAPAPYVPQTLAGKIRAATPIEAAILHIEFLIAHGQYMPAGILAAKLENSLSLKDGGSVQDNLAKWTTYYPQSKGIFEYNLRSILGLKARSLKDLARRKSNQQDYASAKDKLSPVFTRPHVKGTQHIQLQIPFTGHYRPKPITLHVAWPTTPSQILGTVREHLKENPAPSGLNWSLRINGVPITLNDERDIASTDPIEIFFIPPSYAQTGLQFLDHIKDDIPYGYGQTLGTILYRKLQHGAVVGRISEKEISKVWKELENATEPEVGNKDRVFIVHDEVLISGGPLAIRMLPGTEASPVITFEIHTESEMMSQLAKETADRNELRTRDDSALAQLYRMFALGDKPGRSQTPSLIDDLLPVLFDLEFFGWQNGKKITDALYTLLISTNHQPVALPNYEGPFASVLREVVRKYRKHPNASRVNKPLLEKNIYIVPRTSRNTLPHLRWDALVYVDKSNIVLSEEFLMALQGTFSNTPNEFITYLVDVIGHENVERDLPGNPAGTHQEAQQLFPLSVEVETVIRQGLNDELLKGLMARQPMRLDDGIDPPKDISEGLIDQSIQRSYHSITLHRENPEQAARRIVAAIQAASVNEKVHAIDTARDILYQTRRPNWKNLINLLVRHDLGAEVPPDFVSQAQRAILKDQRLKAAYQSAAFSRITSSTLHSLLPPFLIGMVFAHFLPSGSTPQTILAASMGGMIGWGHLTTLLGQMIRSLITKHPPARLIYTAA